MASMSGLADHARRTQLLAQALAQHAPPPGGPFACPYLRGREARNVAFGIEPCPAGLYHALMDLNFRRMGPIFYRPACGPCQECRMLRIPVTRFRASRAQRRCRRRNADLELEIGQPTRDAERLRLYRRYLEARHDGHMDGSAVEFETFLCRSPLGTIEIRFRMEGRLVAVGLADVEPLALSAVYSYFDPDLGARSLGVLNVLALIDETRRRGRPYLYLGYYVRDCSSMSYKVRYRPCEILGPDACWRPV
jgi:arginyl-tRNA--protein-N-Asp/Glu arginylyltransferase